MASQRDLAEQLLQRAKDDEAAAKAMLPDADRLTPYAGAVRYDAEDPKVVDRKTALGWATIAVAWAQAQLEAAEPLGR